MIHVKLADIVPGDLVFRRERKCYSLVVAVDRTLEHNYVLGESSPFIEAVLVDEYGVYRIGDYEANRFLICVRRAS